MAKAYLCMENGKLAFTFDPAKAMTFTDQPSAEAIAELMERTKGQHVNSVNEPASA
jgi:hypothetical protein